MNTLQQQQPISASPTPSGIKSLRTRKLHKMPLHVAVSSTLEQAGSFATRMAACSQTNSYQPAESKNDDSRTIYQFNEFGRWTSFTTQERKTTVAKRSIGFSILVLLAELALAGAVGWQIQSEEFKTTHQAEFKIVLQKAQDMVLPYLHSANNHTSTNNNNNNNN